MSDIFVQLDPSILPRKWQARALEHWAKELRGIVRVVTGGGKTVFSYLCLERFFAEYPDGRAIIVVPTLSLLDQWFVDICDATDLNESDVACYSGGSRPDEPRQINIIVLNTARQLSKSLSQWGPTFLIVDECHRAGAIENSRALDGFHEATLGLSATPKRETDEGFESRIVPALGQIIYAYDYPEARFDGVIVDFELVNVETSLDTSDLNRLAALYRRRDDFIRSYRDKFDSEKLYRIASRKITRSAEHAMRIPWAVKLALQHQSERVIVFHERVTSLGRITELLSELGQNSVTYHSRLSESHRRDNLRLFRRGMVSILVTCRALDEGTNVPEANVAIIAQSTSSTRQRIQRLGRVLRPAVEKRHAVVYTLYTGEEQQTRLAAEAYGLEGVAEVVWKRGSFQ